MEFKIDKSWSLFLDRDGVINYKRENDYVKNLAEFKFIKGSLKAIETLSSLFGKIIIVTNQRGVGKGIMFEEDLNLIHKSMVNIINLNRGRVDRVYKCTEVMENSNCRKPNIGMGLWAKVDFPEIDFKKSIIVGDSPSDIEFGMNLGMKTVFIGQNDYNLLTDGNFDSLLEFSLAVKSIKLQ